MAIDLNNLLLRCGQVEKEALSALSTPITADTVPYFIHVQESFPYITHRIDDVTVGFDSEDFDRYEVRVISRLVIGHVTSNYVGLNEAELYTAIPAIIHAINGSDWLMSTGYPTAMDNLLEATENRMTNSSGFRVFLDGGLKDVRQVGTEFTATYLFNDDL